MPGPTSYDFMSNLCVRTHTGDHKNVRHSGRNTQNSVTDVTALNI